ncbi:MAG: peptidase C11 [Butyrivibrio sp.]|nr:peptidase C11 [Butyrivibrio sp.]
MENRPVGRKKNIQDGGTGAARRGSGLGGGPVGSGAGPGTSTGSGGSLNSGRHPARGGVSAGGPSRGRRSPILTILIVVLVLLGGGGGVSTLLGNSLLGMFSGEDIYESTSGDSGTYVNYGAEGAAPSAEPSGYTSTGSIGGLADLFSTPGSSASEWIETPNTGMLNREVSAAAAPKRTVLKGNGQDTVTILLYLCGTDLESKNSMASKDLQEMLQATPSDQINLIIYTGGCKRWQNNVISSSTNQIYQVRNGQLILLQDNLGSVPMTDEKNLASFIRWGAKNFPADRYELILWDHGGGSSAGYGYDEKFASSGSMTLDGINRALEEGGVNFDFVGFDACLMATVETGLMVSDNADYMIASEETEPGVGWYYTTWLSELAQNTSIPTLDLGKSIIDSFTDTCSRTVPGQKTTLALIDLAELSATVPQELAEFSTEVSSLIDNGEYQQVSTARSGAREFASTSHIDQVDFVHLAKNIGTTEAKELAESLKSAVKYNRTSSNMTNAFGISVFFPRRRTNKVDSMVQTYQSIGIDDSYAKCIRKFAKMETMGQAVAGGSQAASPISSLFGTSGSSLDAVELVGPFLSSFLGGDYTSISGLDRDNTDFMNEPLDLDQAAIYITGHSIKDSELRWTTDADGNDVVRLSEENWSLVEDLDLSMFVDDGQGYMELGRDNTFEFTEDGALIAPTDRTWLSINKQTVAYYRLDTTGTEEDYTIMGRVPAYLNNERVNLILIFDSAHEDGYVAGASYDYENLETETVAKNLTELSAGDTLEFICDYYTYDGEFEDNYYLGFPMTLTGGMETLSIANTTIGEGQALVSYCFTDIYGQKHWTPTITR